MYKDTRYRSKKPKSTGCRGIKHRKTNCLTTVSAPSLERLYKKLDCKDVVQYSAVDRRVTEKTHEKTFAPNLISRRPPGPNMMQSRKPGTAPRTRCRSYPKSVSLPKIHSGLIMSNLDWVDGSWVFDQMKHVVNVSSFRLRKDKKRRCQVHNLPMDDTAQQPYQHFKRIVLTAVDILRDAADRREPVVVSCNAGVNRSAAVVVAYAVLELGWPVHKAIQYIENQKRADYGRYWDTLTNTLFATYIRQIRLDMA